jgi:5'-nucleotidase
VRLALTNDDGVGSPGIHELASACHRLGHDVVIAAPEEDSSGSSAAIGRIRADQQIESRSVVLPDAPGIPAHAVAGPPGLAVLAACLGAFGAPPDAVVSGINAGPNTGHAILHSGTVGAALTASSFGVSALAVSLDVGEISPWETATAFVEPALEILASAPDGTVLNVNVPAVALADVPRDLRWAKLDRFGSVRVAVTDVGDRWVQMEYRTTDVELDPESDTALLAGGAATVTCLEGIAAVELDDLERRPDRGDRLTAFLRELRGGARPRTVQAEHDETRSVSPRTSPTS